MDDLIIEGETVMTPMPKVQGKPMTMDFPNAIREIMSGKMVARVEWGNKDYGLLKDEWLTIFHNNKFSTWLVNDGDMTAQDWIVLTEAN